MHPDGTFKFEGLREGTYTIVMNDDDFLDGNSPFPRHYYPGVRDFSKAEPIVLGQGMAKVDIGSQPANPLRIVIDRKGRCDEKAFAKELDAGIRK